MKLFFRVVLRTLGSLAIIAGILLAGGVCSDLRSKEELGFVLFFIGTVVFVPLAGGYLLFRSAQALYDNKVQALKGNERVFRLGLGLTLFFILLLAICLPNIGRVVLVALLLLILVRVHRGWSSRPIVGGASYAIIFDTVVFGVLLLVVNVVLEVLIGGTLGRFKGGSGSFGGGGASGKW